MLAVLDSTAAALSEHKGMRCGACGHWAEGGTPGDRKTDMLDHLRGHAAEMGFPVIPECPGCTGRETGTRCCVCDGWIPPAKRRQPAGPSGLTTPGTA